MPHPGFFMKVFFLLFIFSLNFNPISMAADANGTARGPLSLLEVTCKEEIKTLCPKEESTRDLIGCLKREHEKISTACKEEMLRVSQANQQVVQRGGGAMSGFGGFSMVPSAAPAISYEGRHIPNRNAPSMNENKINFSTPLYREGNHSLSLSTQGSVLHLNESVQLSSGTKIPTNFYRTELGTNYMQKLTDKKSFGVRASLGYNSDRPFKNGRDLSFSLMSNYSFPSTEQSSWALTIYLSNNGPLANYVPIPGFIYFYRTSSFTGIFGFPFASIQWTPTPSWLYSFSLFGVNINSEIAYGSIDKIQYFSGFNWSRQSFMLHDRKESKDRLSFQEKKLFLGIRTPLFNRVSSELQLGRSFDREVYIGKRLLDKNDGNARINSSLYASLIMKMVL